MAKSQPPKTPAQLSPAVLMVPGLDNSGPDHWQSHWERRDADCSRVDMGDWSKPHRNTWVNRLNLAIHRAARPVVLVAHSLGCMTVAWWAHLERPAWGNPVIGALLVAPPEVDFFPRDDRISHFAPTPLEPLPFPSIVVASRNDPWISFETARWLSRNWAADFVDAGEAGHINAESQLGEWQTGFALLSRLRSDAHAVARKARQYARDLASEAQVPAGLVTSANPPGVAS